MGNVLLVFHFSIRLRGRSCGNVGISPAVGEISKGLVERVGSRPLAFHAFHSPGISTALLSSGFRGGYRQGRSGCEELLLFGVFLSLTVLQPVTLPVHLQDVDVVRQAVQQLSLIHI